MAENTFSGTIKYLALGDSYTIGEQVSFENRFPVQLVKKLGLEGIKVDMPVFIAKTGWTTDELLEAIELNRPDHDYDIVTLLIGVNNQYRGRSLEQYAIEFEALLNKSIYYANNKRDHVFVISIPDYGVTPFGQGKDMNTISREIDLFNAVNQRITQKYDVAYVPITSISRKAFDDTSLVAGDGLHPSGEMYALWVDALFPVIMDRLKHY